MRRNNWLVGLLALSCWFFLNSPRAVGATVNAASCSQSAVQTAVNNATAGDIVSVQAGNCIWSSSVNISGKSLTLRGAGVGQTNITDATSGNAVNINGASAANFVEVTGFTFIAGAGKSNGIVSVSGPMFSTNSFRVHHNRFVIASFTCRGIETSSVYGLIDHNTFDVTASGSVQSISPTGSSDSTDGGFTPWTQPLSLGTNNAVFIEDNTFNYQKNPAEDCIDGYGGARIIIRHNTFNDAHIGFHGTDSGNRRSLFSVEVYENTFLNTGGGHYRGGTMRGGTGVWFNNTYNVSGSGSAWNGITLMLYRACLGSQSGWHQCDGTNWQINSKNFSANASRTTSAYAGTTDSNHVSFCSVRRDTVCSSNADCGGGSDTCTTFFDGPGNGGNACRDQPGRTHDQVLAPVYAWNNTGGVDLGDYDGGGTCNGGGMSNYLSSGRDYINNTQMPGYAPFVYPHPLQTGATDPQPPTGLNAIVH